MRSFVVVAGALSLACVALLSVAVFEVKTAGTSRSALLAQPNPLEPALVRNAVAEVSQLLDIPLPEVRAMDKRIEARTEAQLRHAVHGMMMAAANVTEMNSCGGEYKGCEPLAKNILAVAAQIEAECSAKFFQASEYEKCEADIAAPLCRDVNNEFPKMCWPFAHGETAQDGYIGSEEPANVNGAFCKACARLDAGGGCFAAASLVRVRGRSARVPLSEVGEGDAVESVGGGGGRTWARVLYAHTHKARMATVKVSWVGGGGGGAFELTRWHPVPVFTAACGGRYCGAARTVAAERLKAGDRIYTSSGEGGVAEVASTTPSAAAVRYVVTDNGMLVVGGAVGAAYSTAGGSAEVLPFLALDAVLPGALATAAVRAALAAVMESPLLQAIEGLLHLAATPPPARAPAARGLLFAPASEL